uniref:Phage ABA sandwich domain-containing protein n=1 Tax=viral metagenome TaxID=1070528 RepID=A0A6M3J2S1_9ZZZZ
MTNKLPTDQLSEAVAEVMGDCVHRRYGAHSDLEGLWLCKAYGGVLWRSRTNNPYAKELHHAERVLEFMENRGFDWEIGNNHISGKYYALFYDVDEYYGFGDTRAEAICRAALKAMEEG